MVRIEMAEAEEAQVVSVVADGDQIFKILVSKIFQHQGNVVRVKKELCQILELEDVRYFEPLEEKKQRSRYSFVADFSKSGFVELLDTEF